MTLAILWGDLGWVVAQKTNNLPQHIVFTYFYTSYTHASSVNLHPWYMATLSVFQFCFVHFAHLSHLSCYKFSYTSNFSVSSQENHSPVYKSQVVFLQKQIKALTKLKGIENHCPMYIAQYALGASIILGLVVPLSFLSYLLPGRESQCLSCLWEHAIRVSWIFRGAKTHICRYLYMLI